MSYYPSAQSDPAQNPSFRRRWAEPSHVMTADDLDRLAGTELFFGRQRSAEYFAHRAEQVRAQAEAQQ